MNPYKEDGLRARLSFDPAYCKRCTGPPSVNDGYITGPGQGRRGRCAPQPPFRPGPTGRRAPPIRPRDPAPRRAAHVRQRAAVRPAAPRARPLHGATLSPRLKLSFGSAATGPL